jgi:hypothetical protein
MRKPTKTSIGKSDVDRDKYYRDKKKVFPYEVNTELGAPDPRHVPRAEFGEFVRVPFATKGYAIWMFSKQAYADAFRAAHNKHVK